MTKKYIDADIAFDEILKLLPKVDADGYCWVTRSAAARSINFIPAADVAEVRHGYWIEQSPDFDLCGVAYYKCSECGREQQLNSHYCQFCGARMDESEDKEL